jgi:small-conductance mechanosensitive channel
MQIILRAVEFLSLGLWLGADAFLSFVVAPGAFAVLASRESAGLLVGYSLTRLHFAGIFLGLLFLLARLLRTHSLASATVLCVVIMIALTAVSQFTVSKRMAVLRTQMGSIQNTADSDPSRAEFNKLHKRSVFFEGSVLLLGLAGVCLLVREVPVRP